MGKLVISWIFEVCKKCRKNLNLGIGTKTTEGTYLLMFSDVNFNLKFFSQPLHLHLELCDFLCGKDIYDNALSNVWK